ncbi:uncharacterized protein RCH25_037998 [Pelodytes ibericus]
MGLPVIICSRDAEEGYHWLMQLLRARLFPKKKQFNKVRSCYISNNFSEFMEQIPPGSFAILYHSKKRGRINITDVTDALYDRELEALNDKLGKRFPDKKVIVVIDDLEDSGPQEKKRILESQKTIGDLAKETFLFSQQDKETIRDGESSDPSVEDKLSAMDKILKKRVSRLRVGMCYWDTQPEFSRVASQISMVLPKYVREGLPLFPTMEREWEEFIKKSSLLFYLHGGDSQKSTEDIERFLELCIRINESQQKAKSKYQVRYSLKSKISISQTLSW